MMGGTELGLLVLLGAWSALDTTSVGQFMLSRPLVSGTLAGWILGDPASGLLVGALLEGLDLGGVPAGGARLPEFGPGAVPAAFAAIALGGPGGLASGLALGVLWSLLGRATMDIQRRANGMLMAGAEHGAFVPRVLALRHWICVGLDGLRGAVLAGLGILAVSVLPAGLSELWPLGRAGTAALLLLPAALAAGSHLRSLRTPLSRGALLVVGVLSGSALALLF